MKFVAAVEFVVVAVAVVDYSLDGHVLALEVVDIHV